MISEAIDRTCSAQSGAIGQTSRTAAYTPLKGATNRIAIPKVACSNQSVTQQCAGTDPQRTRTARSRGTIAQPTAAPDLVRMSTAAQPSTSSPTNAAMWITKTRVGRPRLASST